MKNTKDNNERAVAVAILLEITQKGAFNNIALNRTLSQKTDWESHKKAFVTELVNGTLRNLILVDFIIEKFSQKPTSEKAEKSNKSKKSQKSTQMKPIIREILRTAIYQILYMSKVPHSAAVNEAVNLAKMHGFASMTGFINGILRNIVRNHENLTNFDNLPFDHYLSLRYSFPIWLVERLIKQFGKSETEKFCAETHKPPSVTICTNLLKTDKITLKLALEKQGIICEEIVDNETCLNVRKTSQLANIPQFKQGHFFVMDSEANAVSHELLADFNKFANFSNLAKNPNSQNAKNAKNSASENLPHFPQILDLCAAPGGKSFACAGIIQNKGNITACDIYPHKVELIAKTSARLGTTCITAQQNDLLIFKEDWRQKFDFVLLDAPCSGFATIRKRPDIKYSKTETDIQSLAKLQREMLTIAAEYVKIGGTLLYSTCTITNEENDDNINWFLGKFPFEIVIKRQVNFGFYMARCVRVK
ncbi:MAG: methyltransferase domain-containing protein [Firmicutes bacterium]|nr:methyltransferase domain-containing protein [Bacillota bacterium]